MKNFYDFINGDQIFNSSKTMKQRSQELQGLMQKLYQIYGTYWILEEAQTFYDTLPQNNDAITNYFFGVTEGTSKIERLNELLKQNLLVVGMSSKDVVDGWDFEDDELLSVIGKKSIKDSDQLYAEILRVVRLNPLN